MKNDFTTPALKPAAMADGLGCKERAITTRRMLNWFPITDMKESPERGSSWRYSPRCRVILAVGLALERAGVEIREAGQLGNVAVAGFGHEPSAVAVFQGANGRDATRFKPMIRPPFIPEPPQGGAWTWFGDNAAVHFTDEELSAIAAEIGGEPVGCRFVRVDFVAAEALRVFGDAADALAVQMRETSAFNFAARRAEMEAVNAAQGATPPAPPVAVATPPAPAPQQQAAPVAPAPQQEPVRAPGAIPPGHVNG